MLFKSVQVLARNVVLRCIDCLTWDKWVLKSWSQEGEDLVLDRLFKRKKNGFYVDVGAHHPKRFSNTYLFYKKGWSGINIDSMPGTEKLFKKFRPRDITLEMGVAEKEGYLDYYIFNETALNGFSKNLSMSRDESDTSYKLQRVTKIKVFPLRKILETHMGERDIDFLNVDVEGLDLQVLKSNDWSKYRPKVVLAEILDSSFHELHRNPIALFMSEQGYIIYAKLVNTVFFVDSRVYPTVA